MIIKKIKYIYEDILKIDFRRKINELSGEKKFKLYLHYNTFEEYTTIEPIIMKNYIKEFLYDN